MHVHRCFLIPVAVFYVFGLLFMDAAWVEDNLSLSQIGLSSFEITPVLTYCTFGDFSILAGLTVFFFCSPAITANC